MCCEWVVVESADDPGENNLAGERRSA